HRGGCHGVATFFAHMLSRRGELATSRCTRPRDVSARLLLELRKPHRAVDLIDCTNASLENAITCALRANIFDNSPCVRLWGRRLVVDPGRWRRRRSYRFRSLHRL